MKTQEKLNITYDSAASMSYLVIEPDQQENILNYQIEMIRENNLQGFLSFDLRQKNGINYLYYNITSKITLAQFLARKKIKKNEFIQILLSIINTLIECKNYFLAYNQFVIQAESMYINPATLETSLIYLPIATDEDSTYTLKEFVLDLITRKADIEESSGDNFIQKLLNGLKMDTFNIFDFQQLLNSLKHNNYHQSNQQIRQEQPRIDTVEQPHTVQKLSEQSGQQENKILTYSQRESTANNHVQIPNMNMPNPKQTKKIKESPKKKTNKKSGIGLIVFSQIALLVIIAGIIASEILQSVTDDVVTAYAGLALIVAALDFLLLRRLLNKINQESIIDTVDDKPVVNMSKKEIRNVNIPNFTDRVSKGAVARENGRKEPLVTPPVETSILASDTADETTILGVQAQRCVLLRGTKNGVVEEIPITKANFVIGRLREQVDYISQNNAVGKVHAEIISRDGKYLLKDLNSRNGTFINDQRIDSNREYELEDTDKVTFANSKYTFIIQ